MTPLRGRPQFDIVSEPKADSRLRGFSTGSTEKWEEDVNRLVLELYEEGRRFYPRITILAMCTRRHEVLGLCAWRPKTFEIAGETASGQDAHEPPYIHLIGISEEFREHTVRGTLLGSVLLVASLQAIKQQWTGKSMPDVWALVHPQNMTSHNLFARHGFGHIKTDLDTADDRRYRPPGLPIS